MNRVCILFLLLMTSVSSCKVVPFFIPETKKDEREAKRIARVEKRKKKATYKIDTKGESKRKIKKLEKLESKLPGDSVVVGLDSATVAKERAEIENINLKAKRKAQARKIIDVNEIEFTTAKLKTKMKFLSDGKKQNFNAHFILEKDKSIWVSVRVGLEVARALITPERVQAYNRINKVYYDYSFTEIVKLINVNVDFATLQSIIIGNSIGANGEVFELGDFGGTINIGLRGDGFLNKLTYNKSDSTLRQVQLQVSRGSYASNILGMLGEYNKELGRLISTKRVYNVEDSKGKLSVEMEIQKVDFEDKYNTPYTVPKGYLKAE